MADNTSNPDRQSRVAERAYDRYLARGGQNGQDLDDWLEAEREITAEDDAVQLAASTEAVSARMDTSGPDAVSRQDREAGTREAQFEEPTAPGSAPRRRPNGRTTNSAQA